jgi:hypothetical protein
MKSAEDDVGVSEEAKEHNAKSELDELRVMSECHHPNLCQLIGKPEEQQV